MKGKLVRKRAAHVHTSRDTIIAFRSLIANVVISVLLHSLLLSLSLHRVLFLSLFPQTPAKSKRVGPPPLNNTALLHELLSAHGRYSKCD
jgi:hypothetical protein